MTPAGVRFPGKKSSGVAADIDALLATIGEPELRGGPVFEDDFDDQEYAEYGLPRPPRDAVAQKQAYVQELQGKDPTSHLSPEQKQRAKELATENAHKAGILYLSKNQYAISEEAPLIVADASASAARVLKVAENLAKHGSYLASRGKSDWGMAYASVLGFSPRPPDRPIIALDVALEISSGHLTVRRKGDSQTHKMALEQALQANSPLQDLLKASKGEVHRLVLIAADDSASSGDLARLLLRCKELDFRFAFAGTPDE
ncbi:MAG: hypothetical protein GY811_24860, partial [Myxococcales bacterium]|nr:hypothetical protein [Myxococcales bacterium]